MLTLLTLIFSLLVAAVLGCGDRDNSVSVESAAKLVECNLFDIAAGKEGCEVETPLSV